LNPELTSVRHGIPCVCGQVHYNLLDLMRIHLDTAHLWVKLGFDRDVLPYERAEQRPHVGQ
jgi:hypothetical protein